MCLSLQREERNASCERMHLHACPLMTVNSWWCLGLQEPRAPKRERQRKADRQQPQPSATVEPRSTAGGAQFSPPALHCCMSHVQGCIACAYLRHDQLSPKQAGLVFQVPAGMLLLLGVRQMQILWCHQQASSKPPVAVPAEVQTITPAATRMQIILHRPASQPALP